MRYILIFIFLGVCCLKLKSQTNDSKIIYLKFIKEITNSNYVGKKSTILIYDSTANWNAKGNYSLISMVKRRHNLQTTEWDSLSKHFDFNPQATLVSEYFNLHDITSSKKLRFIYRSKKAAHGNALGYWCIYLCPLYFNADTTKCIAIADFFGGKCSTGAKRINFFQKNKDGVWMIVKRLFDE